MVFSFLITEIIMLGLSVGASTFITMAYTHTTVHTVPPVPAALGAVFLYSIRLVILFVIREGNKQHYKRMRADSHIKVYTAPKKSQLWKYILGLFILAILLFLTLQCVNHQGMENFELPIKMGTR